MMLHGPVDDRLASLILVAALCACSAPTLDMEGHSPPLSVRAVDARAEPCPLDQLPVWPSFEWSALAYAPDLSLFLFEGSLDEELAADLQALPLLKASLARSVATEITAADTGFPSQRPLTALQRGAIYTVALIPSPATVAQLGPHGPVAYEVAVSEGPRAGARVLSSLPATLQSDVSPGLRRLHLGFEGHVSSCGPLRLADATGAHVEGVTAANAPCAEFDDHADSCCTLDLDAGLNPNQDYFLETSELVDSHGGPIVGSDVQFTTGSPGARGPTLQALRCYTGEQQPVAGLCMSADDSSISLRLQLDQPATVALTSPTRRAQRLAERGAFEYRLTDLPADRSLTLALDIVGASGERLTLEFEARTEPPLPTLSISEVRSDPLGPEPQQEYVELWNYGPVSIALSGMTLSDDADDSGMPLPAAATLPAGARALLIADSFDVEQTDDVPLPIGVSLLRCGSSLARSGLANRGEPLWLRDERGRLLSSAPAQATGAGNCLKRKAGRDPRRGLRDDFFIGSCSPGE